MRFVDEGGSDGGGDSFVGEWCFWDVDPGISLRILMHDQVSQWRPGKDASSFVSGYIESIVFQGREDRVSDWGTIIEASEHGGQE